MKPTLHHLHSTRPKTRTANRNSGELTCGLATVDAARYQQRSVDHAPPVAGGADFVVTGDRWRQDGDATPVAMTVDVSGRSACNQPSELRQIRVEEVS